MDWKESYRAALVEVDPIRLLSLIHDTEVAIMLRTQSSPAISAEEREEMSDASCGLNALKRLAHAASGLKPKSDKLSLRHG